MKLAFNSLQATPSFGANIKILHADDDEGILMLTKRLMLKQQPAGDTFEVINALTVEDAEDIIKNEKPDIVISDGHIHGMNLENPDGIKIGKFAKQHGVKSIGIASGIGIQSGNGNTVSKAIKEGFEAIDKTDILKPELFSEFFGKLLKHLHP